MVNDESVVRTTQELVLYRVVWVSLLACKVWCARCGIVWCSNSGMVDTVKYER